MCNMLGYVLPACRSQLLHASFVKEVVNISVRTLLCHSGLAYVYSNAIVASWFFTFRHSIE